jgi:hypothetical protein
MSLTRKLGVQNPLLSFVEILVFFRVISWAYFALIGLMYALFSGQIGRVSGSMVAMWNFPVGLSSWFGVVPVWMWILMGLGYLLLITIYWAPGEAATSQSELRGFVLFVLVGLVAGGIYIQLKYQGITMVAETFRGIFWPNSG